MRRIILQAIAALAIGGFIGWHGKTTETILSGPNLCHGTGVRLVAGFTEAELQRVIDTLNPIDARDVRVFTCLMKETHGKLFGTDKILEKVAQSSPRSEVRILLAHVDLCCRPKLEEKLYERAYPGLGPVLVWARYRMINP